MRRITGHRRRSKTIKNHDDMTSIRPPDEEQIDALTLRHVTSFIYCFIATAVGGAVSTLMSVYLPMAVKEFPGAAGAADLNTVSAYINSIFIIGWSLGGFTWGVIGDRLGRKRALVLSVAGYGIFTILTGYTTHWWALFTCRFFSGFGVGGVLVVTATYLTEIWPERGRAVILGFLSIAIPVGIFSAGLINYVVAGWRQGFGVGIIPVIISVWGVWGLKESPKWSALRVLEGQNRLKDLFSRVHSRELIAGAIMFGTMLIGLWAIFLWTPTWIQGLVGEQDAQQQRGLSMMFLGMGGLTGGMFSGFLVNKLGARKALITCFALCAICSFILFRTNTHFSSAVYVEIGILALFFGASQGVLSSFIPQLFPTGIRASATGFCFNIGRLFTAMAVLFVGVMVNVLGGFGNALILFSGVFLIGLVSVILFRDDNSSAPLPVN
jgi:MFS family permease